MAVQVENRPDSSARIAAGRREVGAEKQKSELHAGPASNKKERDVQAGNSSSNAPVHSREQALLDALQTRNFAYRLTSPDEVEKVLGRPDEKSTKENGRVIEYKYGGIELVFEKRDPEKPHLLCRVGRGDKELLDCSKIVLRTAADLQKLDRFSGLSGLNLAHLDLRGEKEILARLPFDRETVWPAPEKMPPGFSPAGMLAAGLDPGLGVRELQRQGLDGRGVRIAVIDMPLGPHSEYRQPAHYDSGTTGNQPPDFHGSAVSSFTVGKSAGVAPGAELHYFTVPHGMGNEAHTAALDKVLQWNRGHPQEKINVVSVSWGAFPGEPGYEQWLGKLAECERQGIFVSTGDGVRSTNWSGPSLTIDILGRNAGSNPNDPSSYFLADKNGRTLASPAQLLVPGSCRTMASPSGRTNYRFDPEGGFSWGIPYVAGLAAIALQVNPNATPAQLRELLLQTATPTDAGLVVNPREFIRQAERKVDTQEKSARRSQI